MVIYGLGGGCGGRKIDALSEWDEEFRTSCAALTIYRVEDVDFKKIYLWDAVLLMAVVAQMAVASHIVII